MKNTKGLERTALSVEEVSGRLGGVAYSPPGDGGSAGGTDRTPGESPISQRKPKGG